MDLFIGDVITCQLAHCDASLCSPSFKSFFHESKHEQDIFVSLLSLVCALVFFYTKKKKIPPKKGKRESERVITFLCGNICIELERKYQIYSKSMGIRRAKIKGRGRDKIDIIVESSGEMKM